MHVDLQCAFVDNERQKTGEISGVKLAGMERDGSRNIQRSQDGDAAVYDLLARFGEGAVSASASGQINHHRTRLHALDCLLGEHKRSAPPRNLRSGNHHIRGSCVFGHHVAAPLQSLFTEFRGVSAFIFRLDATQIHFQKLCSQRLDLLASGRPYVIGFHYSAQTPASGNGLESRNARTQHQHLGRRNGSGSGHEQREEPG